MNTPFPAGRLVRSGLLLLVGATAVVLAHAQPAPQSLPPFVTSATRTPADARTLGSAVDILTGDDLARRQITSLADALGGVSSAAAFSSGTTGAITSLFLRGANSNQALFLVDGLRLNDPNTDYNVFLGGACVGACDSLEIAHGPQSTLYGGEAVGGVISLQAQRGIGAPSTRVAAEAGSFGTVQGTISGQGERGATAWNFSVRGGRTDNARPNNSFVSSNSTLRIDRTVNPRLAVGATARWFHGVYGSPGDHYTNDPDNEERENNLLATVYATTKMSDAWTTHVILGGQARRFVAEAPRAGRATQVTEVTNRRGLLDAQTTFTAIERHRITGGVTAEANHTRNSGFGSINEKQGLWALFVQDEWSPRDDLFLTVGGRNDDFDTFGRATTGRATMAWLAASTLKLRASYGTAFRSPSFLDLYGQSAFYSGNPNLRPERARGWDAGADFYFSGNKGGVSATWFETDYTDLIASTSNFRSVENVQRARTRGLEITTRLVLGESFEGRLSYTYLEAVNQTTRTRLLRRPRHAASADLWKRFTSVLSAGAGVALAAGRQDVDARTFAPIDAEDYTVVRLYGSYAVSSRLSLQARLENVLDERYEEVNGYPALGFAAFGGAEWKF